MPHSTPRGAAGVATAPVRDGVGKARPGPSDQETLAALVDPDPDARERGLARAFGLIALAGLALAILVLGTLAWMLLSRLG